MILLYTNFAVGNLQLSVQKLQLAVSNCFKLQRRWQTDAIGNDYERSFSDGCDNNHQSSSSVYLETQTVQKDSSDM